VRFDAERAAAGVKGFTGAFDARDAALTYWAASRFDPNLERIAAGLKPTPPPFIALCGN